MYGGDIAQTARLCEKIPDSNYISVCLDNLFRQINPLTNGDTDKVFELCSLTGEENKVNCIVTNATSYYSVGGHATAIRICNKLDGEDSKDCNNRLINNIAADSLSKNQREEICRGLEASFVQECLKKQ
jgi:hypothetical protein